MNYTKKEITVRAIGRGQGFEIRGDMTAELFDGETITMSRDWYIEGIPVGRTDLVVKFLGPAKATRTRKVAARRHKK